MGRHRKPDPVRKLHPIGGWNSALPLQGLERLGRYELLGSLCEVTHHVNCKVGDFDGRLRFDPRINRLKVFAHMRIACAIEQRANETAIEIARPK